MPHPLPTVSDTAAGQSDACGVVTGLAGFPARAGKSVTNDEMFKVLSLFLKLGSLVSTSMHDEEAGLEHVNT